MARRSFLPNSGSWNDWLSGFEVGERRYVECTLDDYPNRMRIINTPLSRRPASMNEMKFSTELFTGVSASKAGDIRYLICVERLN